MSVATTGAVDGTATSGSAASIAGAIEIALEAGALSLPLCQDRALTDADASDPNAIVSLASSEPVLAVLLLRAANSPVYDALEPAESVEQAVERLGAEGASGLIAALDADRLEEVADPVLGRALRESRTRSLVISRTGARIAETTGHPELAARIAQLGLLCDVGVPFLVQALGSGARERGDAPELNEFATREVLAELSERCGHRLLVRWNLAPNTLAVLQDRAVEAEERRSATLLGMARAIVSSIGCAPPGRDDARAWIQSLWDHSETLGLSDVDVAALQIHAEDDVIELTGEPGPAAIAGSAPV